MTAGIFACSASQADGFGSLYAARTTAFAGVCLSLPSSPARCALLGGSRGLPPALEEVLRALAVVAGFLCIELRHALAERARDVGDVARTEMDMRVAGGVDIALRAIEARGLLDQLDMVRRLEIARLPGADRRVAGLRLHQGQPADLQLRAGAHQQVGAARACDEARPGFDAMHVLESRGRGVDVDFAGAELLRQRAPLGLAREDVERGERRRRRREKQHARKYA